MNNLKDKIKETERLRKLGKIEQGKHYLKIKEEKS